ncbi:MAG TPA: DUF4440 domain-containing protein [Lautropia sp.]|nr:DUF4440 domain-containing protein [Lautropia sp.]
MNDELVWNFEKGLWTGDVKHYQELIDDECLMVLPEPPYVLTGQQAIKAVADTPRWSRVELSDRRIARPQDGIIVVAYGAEAYRDGDLAYRAHCTSTYRRLEHQQWRVIQHQQTPPLIASS